MAPQDTRGAEEDVDQLYKRHRSRLLQLANKIIGDSAAAEDIVQDAFASCTEKLRAGEVREPLSYLFIAVRNSATRHLRSRAREEGLVVPDETSRGMDSMATPDADPERTIASRQQVQLLQSAIDELPAQTRRAIRLYLMEDRSVRDVAAALSISVGRAHAIIRDALAHCERRLFDDQR